MKKMLVLITTLLLFHFVQAEQWLEAQITFRNGNVLTGLATMPSDPADHPIFFKENKKAKSQRMVNLDIAYIRYYYQPDKYFQYDLVYTELGCCGVPHEEKWLHLESKGPVTLYTFESLAVTGSLNNKVRKSATYWLCLRQGEPSATVIATSDGKNKKDRFNQMAVKYFQDSPELVGKITSGQYQWSDMPTIVNEYNAWKEKNP